MSDPDRTVTVSTKLSEATVDILDGEAERRGTTRAELLQGLAAHLRDARENGLTCPHCGNELVLEL